MKNEWIQKIKENYLYFGGISVLYGLFFVYCLYENFSGITFPVCVVVTLLVYGLFMKKIGVPVKKGSKRYIAGMVLLGFANCYTGNCMFQFFDVVAILLLFIVLMIHQFYEDGEWRILTYVQNMFGAVGAFFTQMFSPFTDGMRAIRNRRISEKKENRMLKEILVGIVIAIPMLFLVIPLLLKSDMIFSRILNNIFSFQEFHVLNFSSLFGRLMMFLVGVMCCYGFFKGMCLLNLKTEQKEIQKAAPVIGITLTSIMTAVYILYSFIQIVYLFLGFGKGLPDGVTYAQYARSGFFELLFVSFINFFLVLVSDAVFKENKLLKILLFVISGCTFIMIGSSGYRMILYIRQYHLTLLRVLVLWFLLVLVFLMIGLLVSIRKRQFPFFRYIVVVMMCCYIPLVYSRPEALIAKYNLSQEEIMWSDIDYLMFSGSYDSIPVIAKLDIQEMQLVYESENCNVETIESQIAWQMDAILQDGSGEYKEAEDIGIRKFNYSEYKARKAARVYLNRVNGVKN